MIKEILITKENLDLALKIEHEIFPFYDAKANYLDSINKIENNEYFLLYDDDTLIGISGAYYYDIDTTSLWLGWFGIRKEYRRLHYGSMALKLFEDKAFKKGYKFTRLYTDKYNNEEAINFYKHNGYVFEDYLCKDDSASYKYPILIGSKSLIGEDIIPWNNRNFNFTKQIIKQNLSDISLITIDRLDEVTNLYEDCFKDNKYFLEQFKNNDLHIIMQTSFKDMFRYCINNNLCYGIYCENKIIALYLAFNYYELKRNDIKQFNNVFTSDYNCTDYPYIHELHDKINLFDKPIMYILAVLVAKEARGLKLANCLINDILNRFNSYTIISDVTNPILLRIFEKRNFIIDYIDDNYYLVHKNHS